MTSKLGLLITRMSPKRDEMLVITSALSPEKEKSLGQDIYVGTHGSKRKPTYCAPCEIITKLIIHIDQMSPLPHSPG